MNGTATLDRMKKPKPKQADRHGPDHFMVRLESLYRDRLQALRARIRERDRYRTAPSVTDLIRRAVEDLLESEGLWPPQSAD